MKPLLAVALVLVAAAARAAATPSPPFDFTALDKAMAEELAHHRAPGGALAVVSGDRIVWAKGYGVAHAETRAAATPGTLFQIGSITKALTAAAVLGLAEEGRIRLDAPIGTYVTGLSPRIAALTTSQLLAQTSGLYDLPAEGGTADDAALLAAARSWGDDRIALPQGTAFSYSNPGFSLAGLVLETVGGVPYADLMSERLFSPLGMARTTLRSAMALTHPHAVGHTAEGESVKVVRPAADDGRFRPAGSATWASAEELARFAIAFLNGGRIEGAQVLPAAVIAQMSAPRADIPALFTEGHYGYGMFSMKDRGLTVLEHGGTNTGFSALLRMLPERRFAIVVFANGDGLRFTRTVETAMDLLAPKAAARPAPPSLPMPIEERARYTGTYANRWPMEIILSGEQLLLRRFGREQEITKIGENRFTVPGPDGTPQEFILHLGPDGRPDYLHMFLWAFPRVKVPRPSGEP